MIEILTTGDTKARDWILLAHGAGAPMTSPFMETLTALLVEAGLCVSRFEFSYMAKRHMSGSKRPPPKAEKLLSEYEAAVAQLGTIVKPRQRLFIGGKSMGGRVASMIAQKCFESGAIFGLVCAGYPFHPPKKLEQLRTAHLLTLKCPTLILQGERDPFGTRPEVETYALPHTIRLHWLAGADHDFQTAARKDANYELLQIAAEEIRRFIKSN